jgi:hypothetical protein
MAPLIILILLSWVSLFKEQGNMPTRINAGRSLQFDALFLLICLIFIVIIGFRDVDIGDDTIRYYEKFEDRSFFSYIDYGEIGAFLLMEAAYLIGTPQLFFIISAAIVIPLYLITFRDYPTPRESLGWGLMLFLGTTVGLTAIISVQRQALAAAVILYGTKYLITRRFWKYLICILLASTFHISALLMVFLYPLTSPTIKYKHIFIVGVCGIGLLRAYIAYLTEFFPQYAFYVDFFIDDGHGMKQLIMYLGFFCLFFLTSLKYRHDKAFNVFFKVYLLGIFLLIGFYSLLGVSLSVRLAFFCLSYMFLLIPYSVEIDNLYIRLPVKVMMMILLTGLYFYSMDLAAAIPFKLSVY